MGVAPFVHSRVVRRIRRRRVSRSSMRLSILPEPTIPAHGLYLLHDPAVRHIRLVRGDLVHSVEGQSQV